MIPLGGGGQDSDINNMAAFYIVQVAVQEFDERHRSSITQNMNDNKKC